MEPRALDWPALLRAGLLALRLKPCDFWALTPGELGLLLGLDARPLPMDRARFLALSEAREAYLVRVLREAAVLREVEVDAPAWIYSAVLQAEDGAGAVEIAVAQLSDRFGPGPFSVLGVPW